MEYHGNQPNPMQSAARERRRQRQLGPDAACACGARDPRCLTRRDSEIVCAECLARRDGRPTDEQHHVAGRPNSDLVVPIPANEHRILSDLQEDWPDATRRNPDGSPLLAAAARLRGWLDILTLMIDRTVGQIPEMLEALDAWLRERIGHRWWDDFYAWLREHPAYGVLLSLVERLA